MRSNRPDLSKAGSTWFKLLVAASKVLVHLIYASIDHFYHTQHEHVVVLEQTVHARQQLWHCLRVFHAERVLSTANSVDLVDEQDDCLGIGLALFLARHFVPQSREHATATATLCATLGVVEQITNTLRTTEMILALLLYSVCLSNVPAN